MARLTNRLTGLALLLALAAGSFTVAAQTTTGTAGAQTPGAETALPSLPRSNPPLDPCSVESIPRSASGAPDPRALAEYRSRCPDSSATGATDMGQERELRAPQTPEPDELANAATDFQTFILPSTGRRLPIYGANLFRRGPSTFTPVQNIPVTPDYIVAPGDELKITVWGAIDFSYGTTVDRSGIVTIPKVGSFSVAGVQYKDLERHLKTEIGKYYRNFQLAVSLGRLHAIPIFVVGNAARPGSYTVSSLSTLVNALFASGGPSGSGSMRAIQLRRGGVKIADFDLYEFLLHGETRNDVRLLAGDVIFIPPVGRLVAISGTVKRPAIFELKPQQAATIKDLIELAGGLTTTATDQLATIERIDNREARKVGEFALDAAGLAQPLAEGDLVSLYPISPKFENAVTLRGNVAMPMRFAFKPGMRVSDLIPDAQALIKPDYYLNRNDAIWTDGEDYYRSRADGSRGERQPYLQGRPYAQGQPYVQGQPYPQDQNYQQSQPYPQDQNYRRGGRRDSDQFYRTQQETAQMRAPDEIRQRTDFKHAVTEVNWDYAVVERMNKTDITPELIPFNLGKAVLAHDPQQDVLLRPGDVVTVFSQREIEVSAARTTRFARVEGEVAVAGVYKLEPGETLRQLVTRVGGLTPSSYLYGAKLVRESVKEDQERRFKVMVDQLEVDIGRKGSQTLSAATSDQERMAAQAQIESQRDLVRKLRTLKPDGRIVLELDSASAQVSDLPEIALEDGDVFSVPRRPAFVTVLGSVFNPNSFIYKPEKSVSDYIEQAGGPSRDADEGQTYIVRADGSAKGKATGGWLTSGFGNERMNPGDTVVVPERLEHFSWTKEFKDWTQILYQFGMGVAGLKVLSTL